MELYTSYKVVKLSQVKDVGSSFVRCNYSFVEQMAMVMNCPHTLVKVYGSPLLRTKIVDIVQDMM